MRLTKHRRSLAGPAVLGLSLAVRARIIVSTGALLFLPSGRRRPVRQRLERLLGVLLLLAAAAVLIVAAALAVFFSFALRRRG